MGGRGVRTEGVGPAVLGAVGPLGPPSVRPHSSPRLRSEPRDGVGVWGCLGVGLVCAPPAADWDGFSSAQDGKLYWCDARTDKIERIDLETGENREVVLSSNNMDMFSVSVFEDYIYWSDRWGSPRPAPLGGLMGTGLRAEDPAGAEPHRDRTPLQDSRKRLH